MRIVGADDTCHGPSMITDRLTARVLGALLLVLPLIIDLSCMLLSPAEVRQRPGFSLVVIVPSLPFFVFGALLLRRAGKLKEDEEDAQR